MLHLFQSETGMRKEKSLLENIPMKAKNILHDQISFYIRFWDFRVWQTQQNEDIK